MNTLYRFYGADDTLLYVGLTINPGKRIEKHRDTKEWWSDVARMTMEQHTDIAALRAAETAAIQAENPLHNIRGKGSGATAERVALLQAKGWHRLSARGAQSWRHDRYGGESFTLSAAIGRETAPAPAPPDVPFELREPTGLIGRWFHSYDADGEREWQGQIIDRDGDIFIVQLYSWWDGTASSQAICEIADMRSWKLYGSNEDMLCANGCEEASSGRPCRAPITHVIRDFALGGSIYRCATHIRHYAGKIEEL